MPDPTPLQRITDHYAAGGPHRRIRQRVADTFREDPEQERLLSWKTTDPARFDALPPTTRISLGLYEAAKDAADQPDPPTAA
jgi:hypothetical protein